MTATTKADNIHAKMLSVMKEIGSIPRTGHNDHFNYDFIEEEKVSEAVRDLLVKHGIAFRPSVTSHEKQGTITVLGITLTFVNVEQPEETVEVDTYGYGQDTQDKGAAKALTSGIKYGLLKTFLVPGGDDPDRAGPIAQEQPARGRDPERPREPAPARDQGERPADGDVKEIQGLVEAGRDTKVGKDKDKTKYLIKVGSHEYGTFDPDHYEAARRAKQAGSQVLIRYTENRYGRDIVRGEDGVVAVVGASGQTEIPF